MARAFRGSAEDIQAALAEEGIRYGISIGRRAPMHMVHVDCLREIQAAGLEPVVFIGSTNGPDSASYDPIRNPLTEQQQKEQLRLAMPDIYDETRILTMDDQGDSKRWFGKFFDMMHKTEFMGKAVMHYRSKKADAVQADAAINPLGSYMEGFNERGLSSWESFNREAEHDEVNATDLRKMSLEQLTPAQRELFAAPDYIIGLAKEARAHNPDRALLDEAGVPVTVLDLTLDRLRREADISTSEIIEKAQATRQAVTFDTLTEAAMLVLNEQKEHKGLLANKETVRLKIASASCNQTAYDFTTNVPNILKAIDMAVEDKADVLCLQELGLTGYNADDYHQWFANEQVWDLLQSIAEYAQEKNPNLVISLGTPWRHADKTLLANDPEYDIGNRPYNAQLFLAQGKVQAASAKSILADGPAEYEPHQFKEWPFSKGTKDIPLPNGLKIPFGKPIIALEHNGKRVTLMHEQCAEGWPGVNDDLSINLREQQQARHIVSQALTHDLSVVINPSASRPQPAINKEQIRAQGLCASGSRHCGVFVYTNFLGSEAGTYAAEGSQIFAQDGKIIHHGQRYTFKDVSYSSTVVDVPVAVHGQPHVTIPHEFVQHEKKNVGGEAEFEKAQGEELAHEEYARSIALWLRDYMEKQTFACQGFVISLSGGQDSAYGAVAVTTMVDLEVKENGVEGFFKRFSKLKYKDEVLKIYAEQGEEAAVAAIKKNLLTCRYMATDNSSDTTRNAAQFLIEGGERNGKTVKGIGGTFCPANVQGMVDEAIVSYSGIDLTRVAKEYLLKQGKTTLDSKQLEQAKFEIKRIIKAYVDANRGSNPALPDYIAKACVRPIPTWANPADDITLQNLQARIRGPIAWAEGNNSGKISLVTSNESEATLGYTTAGGDMHMGGANPIGGLSKDALSKGLLYMQHHGLIGLPPVEALYYVTIQKPTAELRKQEEGQQAQTDEGDLGFSYAQSRVLEEKMIIARKLPSAVHAQLKGHNLFPSDDAERRAIIVKFCNRWAGAQFKRVMGPQAPNVGGNVDPHHSVRTTILGDHFKTDLAELGLKLLVDKLGGPENFRDHFGISVRNATVKLKIDEGLKNAFSSFPVEQLMALDLTKRTALDADRQVV